MNASLPAVVAREGGRAGTPATPDGRAAPQDGTQATGGGTAEGQDRGTAVAFLLDDATESALRGGLAELLGSVQIRRGGIRAACKALKNEPSPRVLIVDISNVEGDPVRELDALAGVCAPDMKVLVLGDRGDIEFYRLVTRRLGVDEYIRKPLTRDGAANLISPYIAGAEPERDRNRAGRIVVVCGARGGVGATTVATNLALQISEQTRSHVALLDLHLRGGHAAMMLGVRPDAGLRTALENPDRVDALFLQRVGIAISDRLRIVSAEEPFDAKPAPTAAGVTRVLELLRESFNIIVVDLPTPPSPAEREALVHARQALIVLTPDVASVRDAQQTRRLVNAQIGAGKSLIVLNRANMPGALEANLVEQGLGAKPEVLIPDMPKQLVKCANLGKPALRECPALRRSLAQLTQEISGVEQRAPKTSFFGRYFRR